MNILPAPRTLTQPYKSTLVSELADLMQVIWVVLCVSQPILMVMAERMVVAQLAKQAYDLHQVC